VGHYLFPMLAKDYELFLPIRSPEKLGFDTNLPNIHLLDGNLEKITNHKSIIKEADFIILIATAWGGRNTFNINVKSNRFIFDHADNAKKIIYFSTASILGTGNKYIPEARTYGTSYVRSKYLCSVTLPKQKNYGKIVTLYPTWVYGGDGKSYRLSHASSGLRGFIKNIWWLKLFYLDYSFHFIHTYDIAQIVKYMLENEVTGNRFVLGNKLYSYKEFIKEAAQAKGKKVSFQLKIPNWFIDLLIKLVGKKISKWDKHCMSDRHFEFETVNAATFGLNTDYDNVGGLLKDLS